MREGYIHFYVRKSLRQRNWQLLAGQYPGGSDDELPPLNVMDPELSRDDSPDHRRHSKNKLVPDLVALKGETLLVIEMKPRYDKADEEKLVDILSRRREDFLRSLRELVKSGRVQLGAEIHRLAIVPCLGFSAPKDYPKRVGFCYLIVRESGEVLFDGNTVLAEF